MAPTTSSPKALSFVAAQSQAIKFWSRNPDSMITRVGFLVEQRDGSTVTVEFARDVDDYIYS